jgi:micrococcal nuclease
LLGIIKQLFLENMRLILMLAIAWLGAPFLCEGQITPQATNAPSPAAPAAGPTTYPSPTSPLKSSFPELFFAYVLSVTDANWFETERGGSRVSIKFYGLRAADRKSYYGLKASEDLGKTIYGRTVRVQRVGFYSSGGVIAIVTLDGKDVGADLIRKGHATARPYFDHLTQINTRYRELENQAKLEGLGLWFVPGKTPQKVIRGPSEQR